MMHGEFPEEGGVLDGEDDRGIIHDVEDDWEGDGEEEGDEWE
jgi:hypothetical protein